jgi:heat-inducible transcriptional repressor
MVLSERRSRILAFIVDDFVESAVPVGSQSLVLRHGLGLSSATVRNEMAALEDEGMITHPHTSAGRIPSHQGYRYYVSSLMPDRELTNTEQMTILHQFHQQARDLEQWAGLAASVLANSLHNVALVTQPRTIDVRLKQIQLVELSDNRALLVVVTNDAQVHQRVLEFPVSVQQESLGRLASRLNGEFGGKAAAELAYPSAERQAEPLGQIEAVVVAAVTDLLLQEQAAAFEEPVVEGVRELLKQPEFGEADRMLDTLEAVDERRLRDAIPSVEEGGVAVVIGDENRDGPYQDMSFVLARYGREGGAGGVVGVLGPTRMAYGESVAHVRYVRDVLTELMRKLYGEDE